MTKSLGQFLHDTTGGKMKLPQLPEPVCIDGRRLYTAGQMRDYAALCVVKCEAEIDDPYIKMPYKTSDNGQKPDAGVEFLKEIMGMK
jgi:hypothetical protein